MYVIYHKFAGYLKRDDNNYTDDIEEARLFETSEDAEIEISNYLERVEDLENN